MRKQKYFSWVWICALVLLLTVAAQAAQSFTNKGGKFDGEYTATIEGMKSKKVQEKVPIELEGVYITVKYKEGEKRYKFDEIVDRRYEKEILVRPFDGSESFLVIFK